MNGSEIRLQLQKQYQQLRTLQMLCVACVAAALITYFFSKWLTLIPLCLALALRLWFSRQKKAYRRTFLHSSAERTLQRHLDSAEHSFDAPVSAGAVRQARLIPCDAAAAGVVCCEGGRGSYHGHDVALTGVTFAHTFSNKRVSFTVGTWVSVQLKADTGMDCRFISPRTAAEQSLKEMLWVETDLHRTDAPAELKRSWQIICREGCDELPGPGFLKQLDRLYDKTEGLAAVCVLGDQLSFLLEDEVLAQQVNIRTSPDKCFESGDLLPGLPHGLRLADYLQS